MKKLLVITLTTLALFTLTGCGAKKDNSLSNNTGVSANGAEEDKNIQTTAYFGKVEKVVGNEVSIKLSDNEFAMGDGSEGSGNISFNLDASEISQLENGETVVFGDGTAVGAATITSGNEDGGDVFFEADSSEAVSGMASADGSLSEGVFVVGENATGVDLFSEIEFNGEAKALIIPAGVEIFNATTGKSGKLSDIKQGSILTIMVDSKTNTVTRVDIMG